MKNYILILSLVLVSACCKDSFIGPVEINILKDGKPLKDQQIIPNFFFVDKNGNETKLHSTGPITYSDYLIDQTTDLEKISFSPAIIYIKYNSLAETDTLEILLDYACNQKSKCSCHDIVLQYMKCNGKILTDYTIRK